MFVHGRFSRFREDRATVPTQERFALLKTMKGMFRRVTVLIRKDGLIRAYITRRDNHFANGHTATRLVWDHWYRILRLC